MEGDRRLENRDVFQEAIPVRKNSSRKGGQRHQTLLCVSLRLCVNFYLANGNTGSISTGTFFSRSSACCIGGLITASLSSIAFALSYDPSASSVSKSRVSFVTPSLIFASSML